MDGGVMVTSDIYYRKPCRVHFVGRQAFIIESDGRLRSVARSLVLLAQKCPEVGSRAANCLSVKQYCPDLDDEAVALVVSELVSAELLLPASSPGLHPQLVGRPASISVVGIVTAGRPHLLKRALRSLAEHAERWSRKLTVIVVDGASDARVASDTRDIVEQMCAKSFRTVYVGAQAAVTLQRRVLSSQTGPAGFRKMLTPGNPGSSRNLVLLLTAGSPCLMLDDDIVVTPCTSVVRSGKVVLTGHVDTRRFMFSDTREAIMPRLSWASSDLLGAHEALLGRWLSYGRRRADHSDWEACDITDACAHVLHGLTRGCEYSIRATMTGLAGDAGIYCPGRLLFDRAGAREALARAPDTLRQALEYRESARIASGPTLTHDPGLMSYCIGLANDALVPCFPATPRGEDMIFGQLIRLGDPRSLTGHVPLGVLHDSGRPSKYSDTPFVSAQRTRLAEVLASLLASVEDLRCASDPESRFRAIGENLIALADCNLEDFALRVQEAVLERRSIEFSTLDAAIASEPAKYPPHLLEAIEQYRDQFSSAVTGVSFSRAIDFEPSATDRTYWMALRVYVREFGNFLSWWPSLWLSAAALGRPHLLERAQ